ncbi:MAG: hypothetical protein ABSE22_00020 [Xanthobacteraceae bacterium]
MLRTALLLTFGLAPRVSCPAELSSVFCSTALFVVLRAAEDRLVREPVDADERETDARDADERDADERDADERDADERETVERDADARGAAARGADARDIAGLALA